jgi:flavodoxin
MKIKIVYETQTGTTQYVVENIKKILEAKNHQVETHSLKYNGMEPSYDGVELLLIGAPTYDDGLVEKTMRAYIDAANPNFANMKVAIFGLGNKTYPQFCRSADLIQDWVKQHQGNPLLDPLKVDGFPDNLQPIIEWTEKLASLL